MSSPIRADSPCPSNDYIIIDMDSDKIPSTASLKEQESKERLVKVAEYLTAPAVLLLTSQALPVVAAVPLSALVMPSVKSVNRAAINWLFKKA